jgi:hypothetical protein
MPTNLMPATPVTESRDNPGGPTFVFKIGGKALKLDYPHAFALGDQLLHSGHLSSAKTIFEILGTVSNRGPRAKIMLAFCHARLNEFAACSATLAAAFEDDKESISENLHSALVFQKLGFRSDAIDTLGGLATRFAGLPTICLLLGDLLSLQGDSDKASECWKMAIKRDRLRGGVALAANRRLRSAGGERPVQGHERWPLDRFIPRSHP